MLLDSNIIIYSAKREHAELRRFLNESLYSVSAVSRIRAIKIVSRLCVLFSQNFSTC
jgi:hypothetical protein